AAAVLAVFLLWPHNAPDPLVAPAAKACRAAAKQLRADAEHFSVGSSLESCRLLVHETTASTAELRRTFTATPYRPTGLSTGSRALVRLVDELTWLSGILADSSPINQEQGASDPESSAVRSAAANVLDLCADVLEDPRRPPEQLHVAAEDLRKAVTVLEESAVSRLPPSDAVDPELHKFFGDLNVTFRGQEIGFGALQVAQNIETGRAADLRSWPERLLGREPGSLTGLLASATDRAAAHLEPHSVWLHNSIRGAIGLAIAVALANLTGVQHAFWVILGALSVLRSSALNTGQNAFRAVGGTVVGSVIGAGLLYLIGHNTPVLWILLPIAVLVAGIVPAAISFATGQAAFTVTLVILFNIAQPEGWSLILFRIEDIALGCAVSLVVGLFFWPRGAAAAIAKALAEAYVDSARYLLGAVDYAVTCCRPGPAPSSPQDARRASAAARRLDDAFRTYLAERGAKSVPLSEMTTLVTGVVAVRLAADAVLELWERSTDDLLPPTDREAAHVELLVLAERVRQWYADFATALEGNGDVPEPLPPDHPTKTHLIEAVRRDLHDELGQATPTAIRILWTSDHLDVVRRLQPGIVTAAINSGMPPAAGTSQPASVG
ncbi:MAG TPA: FUSC family protein, partial [Kribbella sp.]